MKSFVAAASMAAVVSAWNPWQMDAVALGEVITESRKSKYSLDVKYGP